MQVHVIIFLLCTKQVDTSLWDACRFMSYASYKICSIIKNTQWHWYRENYINRGQTKVRSLFIYTCKWTDVIKKSSWSWILIMAKTCGICGKAFQDKSNYNRHMKTHKGQLHDCSTCGKGFSRKDNLRRHQKQCIQTGGAEPVDQSVCEVRMWTL